MPEYEITLRYTKVFGRVPAGSAEEAFELVRRANARRNCDEPGVIEARAVRADGLGGGRRGDSGRVVHMDLHYVADIAAAVVAHFVTKIIVVKS